MNDTPSPAAPDPLAEWAFEIERQCKLSDKAIAIEMPNAHLAELVLAARRNIATMKTAAVADAIRRHQDRGESDVMPVAKELVLIFGYIARSLKALCETAWARDNDFLLFHSEELPGATELCEMADGTLEDKTHAYDLYVQSTTALADMSGAIVGGENPNPDALKGNFLLKGPADKAVTILCQKMSERLKEMFGKPAAPKGDITRRPHKREQAECLGKLRFEKVIVRPDVDISVLLKKPGNIYANNELDPEVLLHLINGEYDLVMKKIEKKRGCMFNPWELKAAEAALQASGYRSTREMMQSEMLGLSGIPGQFNMLCLHDDEKDKLAAWMTYRVSPTDAQGLAAYKEWIQGGRNGDWRSHIVGPIEPNGLAAYQASLENTLFGPQGLDHIEDRWAHRIRKWFPRVMEFHTINVNNDKDKDEKPEYAGAGMFLLRLALEQVERDMPPELLPDMIYCFYYDGIRIIGPHERDYPEFASNSPSRRYSQKAGFVQFGYRIDRQNHLIRLLPHTKEVFQGELKERHVSGIFSTVKDCLDTNLLEMGLSHEDVHCKLGTSTLPPDDAPGDLEE